MIVMKVGVISVMANEDARTDGGKDRWTSEDIALCSSSGGSRVVAREHEEWEDWMNSCVQKLTKSKGSEQRKRRRS